MRLAVAVTIGSGIIIAQSPSKRPAFDSFEVATIKLTPLDWTGGRFIRMQSAQQFVARNHALNTLIAAAYNLTPQAISGGPKWVDSEHWDILAKTPGEVRPTPDEQMAMLRKLLNEGSSYIPSRAERTLHLHAKPCHRRIKAEGEHGLAGCASGRASAADFSGVESHRAAAWALCHDG